MKNLCNKALLLALLSLLFTLPAAAAQLPVVNWSPNVFSIDDGKGGHLLTNAGRQEIANAVSRQLHALQQSGKLPFKLKEVSTETNIQDDMEEPLGLIPIVVADMSLDSQYSIDGKTYHKATVISGLDLAFCRMNEKMGSWKILGTIPLRYYGVLGADPAHPILDDISPEAKSQEYIRITSQGIGQGVDFQRQKAVLRHLNKKTLDNEPAWQVVDVKFGSAKAKEVFAGRGQILKNIVAGFFTSSYQKKTQRIVYPALTLDGWKKDVVRNLYSLQLNSPAGNRSLMMDAAAHPITLNISGLGKGELPLKNASDIQRQIGYKAWLEKSPVEGREQREIVKSVVKQQSKIDQQAIQYNDADVFLELLIGASSEMGKQKM